MFVGWVFVRVLMGIVSRATAVVAPEERKSGREREREGKEWGDGEEC